MRIIAFLCFILSGAASVSYQMLWLREGMTYFGVITPVISAVLSVFMLGLTLGTFLAGKITTLTSARRSLILYAVAELLIAGLALAVPTFFKWGYTLLLNSGTGQSGSYLFLSCVIITLTLLPACTLIGATLPLLMRCLKSGEQDNANFSFLYYANLLGALTGCFIPLALIELLGITDSLMVVATLNLIAALLAAYGLSRFLDKVDTVAQNSALPAKTSIPLRYGILLFSFGFVALGSEVIWIKSFMPVVGPTVYSFASILAIYLVFNALGTDFYRYEKRSAAQSKAKYIIILMLPASALLPVLGSSLFSLSHLPHIALSSIALICFCFGYLTPSIIDEVCKNDAYTASRAYIYNCLGCIVGPAFTTYILFPFAGIKGTLVIYAFFLLSVSALLFLNRGIHQWRAIVLFVLVLAFALKLPNDEDRIRKDGILLRDHVGYIGAIGEGMNKKLLVNGIGMTTLTTITKNMAHLPLTHHPEAKSALVICFGMGTTVRSLTTWPLKHITAVELSKGVTQAFGYFHADAPHVLADPRVTVVVDDGRRFLNRSHAQYDIIIIDPPPPVSASGSGLLYTSQFLGVLKQHLATGGVLQHWIPGKNGLFVNAAVNAIKAKFRFVKIYHPIELQGIHILASDSPLPDISEEEFVKRLPPGAISDLKEWQGNKSIQEIAKASLRQVDEKDLLKPQWSGLSMSDDHLYNEFFLLRTMAGQSQ